MTVDIQTIDVCIHNLVQLLKSYSVRIPPDLIESDDLSEDIILDILIQLIQDNNLEYDKLGKGVVMKQAVKQAYVCSHNQRKTKEVS
jgi:hypothetical protein